jgi:iron complex outermembrane receptor protein
VGQYGLTTDLDGGYTLPVEPGTYEVVVSYVGYETKSQSVTLAGGEVKTLDISLDESLNILKTATVTSGKHEVALGEVTVSLDVIKPSLIQNTNQTSLSGLLDKVPGVSMIGDQANIRGGSGFSYGAGSRVLLLVDDMPIYQADAGFPQWEDVPLENIEQVEVVKGASSALYGSSALNGIINVRTAYAKSKPETYFAPFFTVFMNPKREELKWWDSQPYNTGFNGSHRRKIGKLDLVLGGHYYRNESYRDSSSNRRGRFNLSTRYRITDRLSVGVNTNFNKNKGSSFFFWNGLNELYRPGASISKSNNFRYNVDPFVTWFDPANNRHKLMGRFFSVENNTGTAEADQSNVSDVYYGEYQFQRKMEKLGLVASTGLVYVGTKVRAPLYGNTEFISRNVAGYLQLDKKFFEKLTFSAGFRYEGNTVLGDEEIIYRQKEVIVLRDTIPGGEIRESRPVFRFGTSYQLSPNTFLRGSWGQGYRFPTIAEKFIFTSFGNVPIAPNFDLRSETGWTAELGLRKGFRLDNFIGYLDLAAFVSEYEGMMEFIFVIPSPIKGTLGAFQSQNVGDTHIKGAEISISGKGNFFGWETTILAGYTYIDPKFKEFGYSLPPGSPGRINAEGSSVCYQPNDPERKKCKNVLKYRFRHTAKLDLEMRRKKFSAGVAAFYNSFMENIDAAFETPLLKPPKGIGLQEWRAAHSDGDVVWSLRSAFIFTEHVKTSVIVNNLFNREYATRPAQLDSPRHVTLRMDFNF